MSGLIGVTTNNLIARVDQAGGEGGIRTHGTREGSTVFETARFNRSRTSPHRDYLIFPQLTDHVTMPFRGVLHQNRAVSLFCHYAAPADLPPGLWPPGSYARSAS